MDEAESRRTLRSFSLGLPGRAPMIGTLGNGCWLEPGLAVSLGALYLAAALHDVLGLLR